MVILCGSVCPSGHTSELLLVQILVGILSLVENCSFPAAGSVYFADSLNLLTLLVVFSGRLYLGSSCLITSVADRTR